jgi:dihydrofolate synthase / folylpolyglutamate synthase
MLLTIPWPPQKKYQLIRPGLENTRAFLTALKNPHHVMPPVIHVAGTNGKGSTVATLASILEASGYKSHVYTSPHLSYWNERIRIAGKQISDDYYIRLAKRCEQVEQSSELEVSHFEALTSLAFLAFAENPADCCIVEVGIGGRLDATNVVDPVCSIITSISLDHCEFLGSSLPEIASEKAGIMKAGVPCIAAYQSSEVSEVLIEHAREKNVPLLLGGRDWSFCKQNNQLILKIFEAGVCLAEEIYPLPRLEGEHQLGNAALALVSALALKARFPSTEVSRTVGILNTNWPGRIQKIPACDLPITFPNFSEVWLDGAHNQDGARKLGGWLKQQPKRELILIAGCSRGRSLANFIKELDPGVISDLIVVEATSDGTILSSDPAEFSELPSNIQSKSLICSIAELQGKLAKPNWPNARAIICGSLHLVGDFLRLSNHQRNAS